MAVSPNRYYSGPVSDHFDGTHFFNPGGVEPRGGLDLLRWKLGGGNIAWPKAYPSPFGKTVPESRVEGERLAVTMIGHASLMIQMAGLNILTDPVWSERTSPFSFAGPKRINPPGVAFESLPPIDVVIVTHNHYDHMDLATLKALQAGHRPLFVTPLGNDAILKPALADARISVMDWGGAMPISDSVTLHCEPCHHWSARGANDRRMALWAAFVLETPVGKVYHVGDTSFHGGINYRAAKEKHGGFRFAGLPIGAYEPRWFMEAQHQNAEEAVEGMQLCGARFASGHHWGTVKLTNEAIDGPVMMLRAALDARGLSHDRFRPLQPGEVFDVPV